MAKKELDNVATADMNGKELGEICQRIGKRMALDAWKLGTAVNLAVVWCKANGMKIKAWKERWVLPMFSKSDIDRAQKLAEQCKDSSQLEKLGLMEAMYQFKAAKRKETKVTPAPVPVTPGDEPDEPDDNAWQFGSAAQVTKEMPHQALAVALTVAIEDLTANPTHKALYAKCGDLFTAFIDLMKG